MDQAQVIYLLIGLLQVIGIGLTAWALLTLVQVLERLAKLEAKFDEFPVQLIYNNRHRIEQAERMLELHTEQISNIRTRCAELHR